MRVSSTYLALMVLSTFGESQKKNGSKKCYTNSPTWRRSRNCLGLYGLRRCGRIATLEGIMNAKGYVNILLGNLKKCVRKLGIQDSYLFQKDNDPKHTALITRELLLYNVRGLLETPPQSPDINPIENLWSLLETKIRKCKCSSRQMFIENLKKEWDKIGHEVTVNLVNLMPRRLQAIIYAKGLHTKY
jgi:hypothetical protein